MSRMSAFIWSASNAWPDRQLKHVQEPIHDLAEQVLTSALGLSLFFEKSHE